MTKFHVDPVEVFGAAVIMLSFALLVILWFL
jgi:hypothetical protein